MVWNWQHPDWPNFRFSSEKLIEQEAIFHRQCGVIVGTVRHLGDDDRTLLVVDLMSTEAVKTSEIEGDILDRDSVQSSLRRQFGLQSDARRSTPAEQGIAQMLADVYRRFDAPLDEPTLFRWHEWLMQGRRDISAVGGFRKHEEPMQVVSGPLHAPKVHFEAPPSHKIAEEMSVFCAWVNETKPGNVRSLPTLVRAGLAHLYFESIHPFEDGNGRIGRAIAEKALAQGAGQPSLTALSLTIQRRRVEYYDQLESANKALDVDDWLAWFAEIVLAAQRHTMAWLDFLVEKAKVLDRLRGAINARQEKALLRVMRDGPGGFQGGLSASKYMTITGAPAATARRDLTDLVSMGVLRRTGQLKGTRYWLVFDTSEERK